MKKVFTLAWCSVFILLSIEVLAQSELAQVKSKVRSLWDSQQESTDDVGSMIDSLEALLEEYGTPCDQIELRAYRVLHWAQTGAHQKALEQAMENLRFHHENTCEESSIIYIYRALTTVYIRLEDFTKADSLAILGINVWDEEVHDSLLLAKLYLARGASASHISDAMPYFQMAMAYSDSSLHRDFRMSILNNIGAGYADNMQFEKAKVYFDAAFRLAEEVDDYDMQGTIYSNLAWYSTGTEQLRYMDSALHYARLSRSVSALEVYTFNMATALYSLERYKEAYDSLMSAYDLKDTVRSIQRAKALKVIEQRYKAEVQAREIQKLKLDQLASENKELRLKRNQVALIIGSLALLILMVFFAFSYINTRRIKNKLAVKNKELDQEKKRSDDLLLNILPAEVAEELKNTGRSEARLYNNVTVLFADFVSFTVVGEHLTPTELVDEIHRQFTQFDLIMEKFGLEKIKTIGDAYLAVCGLPDKHSDHAIRAVHAAQELVEFTERSKSRFKIRVGLNSGPVVAGIVGVKKYAYDIWGDTVNTAARMEENSESGRINISKMTYDLVAEQFRCTHRGKVAAKHKGMVDMYFVEQEV